MPVVWGKHDRRQLFLNVAITDAANAQLVEKGQHATVNLFSALVDTGATRTCITRSAASKVGLVPRGKANILGVGGLKAHNTFIFHVGFMVALQNPAQAVQGTPMEGVLHLLREPIQGVDFDAGDSRFELLLGMDVISTGSLKIEGDGSFSWAW